MIVTAEELDALQAMRDQGGARPFFETVRRGVSRLDDVTRELDALKDGMPTGGGHASGSGIGKPTEARALWLVCDAPVMAQRLEDERDRLTYVIGRGLVLVELLRVGLGGTYADAVERHFVDGMRWADVAEAMGYSESHAKRLGGVALDWLDWKTSEGR